MDNSTENVTLLAVFINDVLTEVEKLNVDKTPIATMTKGYDLTNPYNRVPITIYNDLCAWVEKTLGEATIIAVGKNIGETIQMKRTQTFNSKLQFGLLKGLVSKCASVKNVKVSYLSEVAEGNEFDQYLAQWTNK